MFKKSLIYIIIVYATQVLSIILNILLIRNLSLEQLGQVTLAKIYFQFMDYSHLGSRFAMDRYVPTMNNESAIKITNTVFLLSFCISIIIILIVYFFISSNIIVLIFMISGLFFSQVTIHKSFYRAKGAISSMIKIVLATLLMPLFAQVIAIKYFDFNIFIFIFFISYACAFAILYFKFRLIQILPLSEYVDRLTFLFRSSSLLFIISLVIFLSFSIDKIVLEKYRGVELLGEYSIVLFVFATLRIIPGTLSELVFPKIIKDVSSNSKVFFPKELAFVFFPTLIAIILANTFMDYFIAKFTDYSYLLNLMHIISWGVLPFAITSIYYHIFNALDLRFIILKINIIILIIYLIYLVTILIFCNNILFFFSIGKLLYGILLIILYFLYLYGYQKHKVLDVKKTEITN